MYGRDFFIFAEKIRYILALMVSIGKNPQFLHIYCPAPAVVYQKLWVERVNKIVYYVVKVDIRQQSAGRSYVQGAKSPGV